MKLVVLVGLIACFQSLTAQDKTVIKEPYLTLYRFDDNLCYAVDHKKKRIYWNGKAIDSTSVSQSGSIYFRGTLFIYQMKNDLYFLYSIDKFGKLTFQKQLSRVAIFRTRSNLFITNKIQLKTNEDRITHFFERNFFRVNLATLEPSTFYDMDKATGFDSLRGEDLCSLYELPDNKLIATICYCGYGACSDFRYFLVDILTADALELKLNTKEPDNEFYAVRFHETNDNYHLVSIDNYAGKKENGGYFIYDRNFKDLSKSLDINLNKVGVNHKKGEHLSDNVKSRLDDGLEVIITYRFAMPLERSLFAAYSGLPLLQEDLKRCSKDQLDLIRNMVFAKYNYKFDSEYYQAYFSLYSFYDSDEARKGRVKDVSKLLTSVDKSNLAMIGK